MTSVEPLLTPIRERIAKATPGPWDCDGFADGDVISLDIYPLSNQNPPIASNIKRHEDADFLVNAPADIARLIAAVEAIVGLHRKNSFAYTLQKSCARCGLAYPCPTVTAVTTALGGGE